MEIDPIFGRVFSEGCTEAENFCGGILGQVGFGDVGADPSISEGDFLWFDASYNADHTSDNNDEYSFSGVLPALGEASYAFRFSGDGGLSWSYCDLDGLEINLGRAIDYLQNHCGLLAERIGRGYHGLIGFTHLSIWM